MSIADVEFIEKNSSDAVEKTRVMSYMDKKKSLHVRGNVCFAGTALRVGDHVVRGNKICAKELIAERIGVVGCAKVDTLETGIVRLGEAGSVLDAAKWKLQNKVGVSGKSKARLLSCTTNQCIQWRKPHGFWRATHHDVEGCEIEDADVDHCYEVIRKLPLRRFSWKQQHRDRRQIGWTAHELRSQGFSIDENDHLDMDHMMFILYGAVQKMMVMTSMLSEKLISLENAPMSPS